MRVVDTPLTTSVDPVSYGLVLTATSGGAGSGGLFGDGVVIFQLGTMSGSLTCLNQRYDGAWPVSTPLPSGASCEVNGRIVVLEFPVAAQNLAGAGNGIRIYTQRIRSGSEVLLDISDEVDVYPLICE